MVYLRAIKVILRVAFALNKGKMLNDKAGVTRRWSREHKSMTNVFSDCLCTVQVLGSLGWTHWFA